MKRRKRLWIACAALAVVVVLCAFALAYRPAPYEFLRDARPTNIAVYKFYPNLPAGTTRTVDYVSCTYALDGTVEAVVKAARQELPASDGWRWGSGTQNNYAANRAPEFALVAIEPLYPENPKAPRVCVRTAFPATPMDRIMAWLHNR